MLERVQLWWLPKERRERLDHNSVRRHAAANGRNFFSFFRWGRDVANLHRVDRFFPGLTGQAPQEVEMKRNPLRAQTDNNARAAAEAFFCTLKTDEEPEKSLVSDSRSLMGLASGGYDQPPQRTPRAFRS